MVEPEGGLQRDGGKTPASASGTAREVPASPASLPIHYGSLAVPEAPPSLPSLPPPIAAETHYDVLGVSPKATRDQIDKAYKFCLDMYRDGALATYSLLEAGDAETVRSRIARAHEVLSDVERRRVYDASLGLTSEPVMAVPFEVTVRPDEPAAPATAQETPIDSLSGADLRRIRESRGISLREIATASKVGLRFLEYIEEDRFALLPPPVYLRGFLQEYARALGIDPRRATDAYMSRLPPRT